KSAQIREILISESAWEEMTCLFAPSQGDIDKALKLMNEAERLGSKSARSTFISSVKGKG
ncbi:hypothetical protein QML18_17535, partial [Klebsiella pneumoniae]